MHFLSAANLGVLLELPSEAGRRISCVCAGDRWLRSDWSDQIPSARELQGKETYGTSHVCPACWVGRDAAPRAGIACGTGALGHTEREDSAGDRAWGGQVAPT